MMKKLTILLAFVLVIVGCTRASQTTFTDPNYVDHKFNGVLVFTTNMDLRSRQLVERTMVKRFKAYGVKAHKALELLPPTRQYTLEQASKILKDNGIDSVLFMTLANQEISSNYVPQPLSSTTTGTITTYGNTAYLNSRTQTSGGGFYVSKPTAYYDAQVFDAKNLEKAWIYNGELRGNAFADFDDLAVKAGAIVVKSLIKEGLYPRR